MGDIRKHGLQLLSLFVVQDFVGAMSTSVLGWKSEGETVKRPVSPRR